jgi:erythromycin esterase-like protein
VDPGAAREARRRYGCLTPWQEDPAHYGHHAAMGGETCEKEVSEQLVALLERRLEYAPLDGEPFFNAAQNARIVRAAERYYRAMYRGSRESWNLRDRHMFGTLQMLMRHRRGAKTIVWAHNSHVGNAAATAMGWEGEFNIGELCRTAYGNEMVAIGFGTDRGTVAAASDWDSTMEIKNVLPARNDSYEYLFRHAGHGRALTDWRARPDLRELLAVSRLERAIGVVYRPESELLSHYFQAMISDQFDAFVWFETSRAITPLSTGRPQGMPETYPFGL